MSADAFPDNDPLEPPQDSRALQASAFDALVPMLFHELRAMAHRQLAREYGQVTLQTTELVHEAYLRLAGSRDTTARGRDYIFAAAARAMRQVLVDAARRRNAAKRGSGEDAASLDDASGMVEAFSHEMLDLDDALNALDARDHRAARVVECRFFAGMTVEDTATALGISPRTVKSDWASAREWLRASLSRGEDGSNSARDDSVDGSGASHDRGDDSSNTARDASNDTLPDTLDRGRAAALLRSADTLATISTIERYHVVRMLGRGSSGAVFLARDPENDAHVAVKVLAQWLGADPVASRRFLNEVRAVADIASPRIATVFRSGRTDDEQLFIAMEYLDGATLRERLRDGPLSPGDAVRIAIDVADGLQAAHAHGVIHRDIKPENILLTPRGACIVDFGIAKLSDESQTRPGTKLGTAAYMSPEQARGVTVDARTDLWSLGIVMYEMLCGARPYHADSLKELMARIQGDAPPQLDALPADLPPQLRVVVQTCLQKSRENRYASAAALTTALAY